MYDKEEWCQFATLQNPCIDLKLVRGAIGNHHSITGVLLARNKNISSLCKLFTSCELILVKHAII